MDANDLGRRTYEIWESGGCQKETDLDIGVRQRRQRTTGHQESKRSGPRVPVRMNSGALNESARITRKSVMRVS
jgi:hypothetical protein